MSTHSLIVAESGNRFISNTQPWQSFSTDGIKQNRYNSSSNEYHGIMRFDVASIRAKNISDRAINIKFHMTRGPAGDTGDTKTGLGIAVGYGVYKSVEPSFPVKRYNEQALYITDATLNPGIGTVTTYEISNASQAAAWIDYLCADSNKCFLFSRRLIDEAFSSYARINACTLEITWESRATAVTAPTSLSATPNPFENSLFVWWEGASAGANNPITGYNVAYQTSSNGSSWSAETIRNTTSSFTLDTSGWARGTYFRFRVQTVGAVSGLNSGYTAYTSPVRKNIAPNIPTNLTYNGVVPSASFYSESPLTFAWNAASVPSGGSSIAGYQLRIGTWNGSSYAYGAVTSTQTARTYSLVLTNYSRGQRLNIQVRTVDSLGATSSWAETGRAIFYNQLPAAPTISYPIAGSTVYGVRPRICFTLGAEPDGQNQTPVVTINGVTASSSWYSRYGAFAAGSKLVVRSASNASGGVSVSALGNDGLVNGTTATRTFTVKPMAWEDSAITDDYDIVAGVTTIKAIQFSDLRQKIDNVRIAYGLSAVLWPALQSPVSAAVMLQMQSAIDEIRTAINKYDAANTGNLIPAFNWSAISPGAKIMAAHIKELRDALQVL